MAKGLSLPVKANKKGGALLMYGTPYTEQTIRIGLTPNYNMNPFQAGGGVEIGISERFIFANNVPGARANARREIVRNFSRWRSLEIAKIAPGNNSVSFSDVNEELNVKIKYVDLEADKEGDISTNLLGGLRSTSSLNSSG